MNLPDLAYGPEWALLELIVRGIRTPAEQCLCKQLLAEPDLHWGELLEQAVRHKVTAMLAHQLVESSDRDGVPLWICHHLRQCLKLNRHRLSILRREAARIAAALETGSVCAVGTKGIVFETSLYGGQGSRYLNDIDFCVSPGHREQVLAVMASLGYQPGTYSERAGRIVPHERQTMLTYHLNPDHLPGLVIATGDPFVPAVQVDFACSLTWARSPFEFPMDQALAQLHRQPIPGKSAMLPCFVPEMQFLHAALHLFREAWMQRWADLEKDVTLGKFADVYRLWHAYWDKLVSGRLVSMLGTHNILDPLVWVLSHLDALWGTTTLADLDLSRHAGNMTIGLNSVRASGGRMLAWEGTMRDRLHCKDRSRYFRKND